MKRKKKSWEYTCSLCKNWMRWYWIFEAAERQQASHSGWVCKKLQFCADGCGLNGQRRGGGDDEEGEVKRERAQC